MEELTEQEKQPATTTTTVASDAMLEVASELTESGEPAEAVTPMKDDVVAEAPTDVSSIFFVLSGDGTAVVGLPFVL